MAATKSPQELIKFVVAAGGNLPLAAERAGVSKEDLVALVTGTESSTLSEHMRGMLLLQLYDTIIQTQIAFQANLPYMSPNEVARAYSSLVQSFGTLSNMDSPELSGEVRDAATAKQALVTRLDQWKRNQPKIVDADKVEDVS